MNTEIKQFLDSEGCYFRSNPETVDPALSLLGVLPKEQFVEFYRSYAGPFGSDHTGFTLSDIVNGSDSSIVEATQILREKQCFLKQHWVISDMCAHAVLVYDCITDGVYNVDFEGGVERLKQRMLAPQWPNFEEFLDFYFLGRGIDEPPIQSFEQDMVRTGHMGDKLTGYIGYTVWVGLCLGPTPLRRSSDRSLSP